MKEKLALVAKSVLRLKQKRAPAIIIGLLLLGLFLTYVNLEMVYAAEFSERYFFVMHIIIVVALGVYFWWLQKGDTDKMQQILDKMQQILDKIDERETNAIAYWGGQVLRDLNIAIEYHRALRKEIIAYLDNKTNENKAAVLLLSRRLGSILKDYHVVAIRAGVAKLDGIVKDPALVTQVTNQTSSFASVFEFLLRDEVWQDDQILQNEPARIDEQISVIETAIDRIKTEMPKIEPPKMRHLTTDFGSREK